MHSDNEIVVSHKNDTFYEYTVAKPWKHYANLKKPDANSTYCMIQFIWNVPKRQINRDHPGLEKIGEMGKVTTNRYRIWGGGDENILKLALITVAQLCEYIKNLYTLNGWTLWYINFISTKL